jgi:hypothetical protein
LAVKILAYAWSLPGTLLGLLLSLALRPSEPRWQHGAIWVRVGWFWPPWVAAITLGAVVLHRATPTPRLILHETRHVKQWLVLGPLFAPAYLLACAWAWVRTGEGYRWCWFEVDARKAEELCCPPRVGTTYREGRRTGTGGHS